MLPPGPNPNPTRLQVLLVVDASAAALSRLWCLWELWQAGCGVAGATPAIVQLLNAGADWDVLADQFFRWGGLRLRLGAVRHVTRVRARACACVRVRVHVQACI